MFSEKEIDILYKAKKDRLAINIFASLSLLFLVVIVALEVIEYVHDYTIFLATLSVVCMALSAGASKWVSVSRDKLIQTLEELASKDPEALKLIANRNRSL